MERTIQEEIELLIKIFGGHEWPFMNDEELLANVTAVKEPRLATCPSCSGSGCNDCNDVGTVAVMRQDALERLYGTILKYRWELLQNVYVDSVAEALEELDDDPSIQRH